jgi:uncharacterized integral membrane protein
MADTDHVSELDEFDVRTVWLYRVGISGAAIGLLLMAAEQLGQAEVMSFLGALDPVLTNGTPVVVLCFGVALIVANLHLYDKKIRWMIQMSAWMGVLLLLGASTHTGSATSTVEMAGVGFIFLCLSSIAMKEQLCFQLPGLRLVPLLLVLSLIPMLTKLAVAAGALLGAVGVLYLSLAIAKLRMPLHYDIGDKNRYDP